MLGSPHIHICLSGFAVEKVPGRINLSTVTQIITGVSTSY